MTVTRSSHRDRSVTHGVSHTTPTRPDPTRPLITTRVSSNTTSSRYVTAGAGDVVVSATRIDEHTDLGTIEHLDFDPALPCEHGAHPKRHTPDQPAKYLIRFKCPGCPISTTYLLCKVGWDRFMAAEKSRCSGCGHMCHASEALSIVEVLS